MTSVFQILLIKPHRQVIFVSSDQDQKTFDTYFEEMPWLAAPFQELNLRIKFKVRIYPQQFSSTRALSLVLSCSTMLYKFVQFIAM